MRPDEVPAPTIRRISLYRRQLEALRSVGKQTVSSKELGGALNLTDAQVRKDLACFGQFGQPGIGYRVNDLIERIRHILAADRSWNVVLVGVGRLGNALARYRGFANKGYRLVGVLDNDPAVIGTELGPECSLRVRSIDDLEDLAKQERVHLGVVCVPGSSAQGVVDRLVSAGVHGVLNFAPVGVSVPEHVVLASVDLSAQLEQLSFQVSGILDGARNATR